MKKKDVGRWLLMTFACMALLGFGTKAVASSPDAMPESVVALSRSISELWLLSGGSLSGVTEDAMDLAGLTEDTVSSIGSLAHPSTEAILALKPDLVLMTLDMPAHKALAEELEQIGIPMRVIDVEKFDDYAEEIRYMTGLTGREDLYEKNVTEVRGRLDGILGDAKEVYGGGESFLCMRVSSTKNKVLKNDYFACEIMTDFGLNNIAADNGALDELNLEAIAMADPDWIFVIPMGDKDVALQVYEELFASQPVWSELSAAKNEKIEVLPPDLFLYKPNAAWDQAYQYMYDILVP